MKEASSIKVWDIAVRIFHWSLVALFFTAYFTGDDDSTLHVYAGYGVLGLVLFRVVWALGGWMVLALLVSLFATCWSGLEAYAEGGKGPLARIEAWAVPQAAANGDERDRRGGRHGRER